VTGWATAISAGPGETQALNFIVTNDNNALFSVQPSVTPTGTLSFAPAPNANGIATVKVKLHDDGGIADGGVDTSAEQTFTITVGAVNDMPSFTAPDLSPIDEDAGAQSIASWASFSPGGGSDEAGQTPTYIVSNLSNPAMFAVAPSVAADGTLTYTAADNANGSCTFDMVVKDSGGTDNGGVDTSTSQTFTITVNAINDAPTASAAPVTVTEDGSATVELTGSDVETAPADLVFTILSLPTRGTLKYAGSPVTVGQTIVGSPSDLLYEAGTGFDGAGSDSFTFDVTDSGDPVPTPDNVITTGPVTASISITPALDPSTFEDLRSGVLRVTGGAGDDTIDVTKVGTDIKIVMGINAFTTPLSEVSELRIWGRGGNDRITINSGLPAGLLVYVNGGAGADKISSASPGSVLVGGDGADELTASGANAVLIGGAGSDKLTGGTGHDVVVGGTVKSTLTLPALRLAGSSWATSRSTTNLGVIDTEFDQLMGGGGADWFVRSSLDKIADLKPADGDIAQLV
jgi:Ca2+-binding RTX toxin-like protein